MKYLFLLFTVIVTFGSARAQTAELPLVSPVFTDHMVLQRDQADPVWGWAKPGETITVTMAGRSAKAVAGGDGKWLAKITPPPAGGPYELTVTGSQTVAFKDVLVGDVWICGGQSNMEFGVRKLTNATEEIAHADHPQIRLFTVSKNTALQPLETLKGRWEPCSPATIVSQGTWDGFSAVGYFFGRDLHENLKVPVGLIQDCWGGTNAETWTSAEALTRMGPDFLPQLEQGRQVGKEIEARTYDRQKSFDAWNAQVGATAEASLPSFDASTWKTMRSLPHFWGANDDPALNGFLGAVLFRREIDLPAAAAGKAATLSFGNVDDADTTWVNGVKVGGKNGWGPRNYPVPAGVLKAGRNTVAVWVLNTTGPGGLAGKAADYSLNVTGLAPVSLAGDWQYKVRLPLDRMPPRLFDIAGNRNWPTALSNGMIAPLTPYGIKGAIWYQGEDNASRPEQYRRLLPTLIADWRARWGQGDFPFLIVQLAAFGGDPKWADLREAQAYTARTVPNAGLVTAIDIGEHFDIHPKDKKDVGERLARVARAQVYGEKIEFSGPAYQTFKKDGSSLRIAFDHGAGLHVKDGSAPQGFVIAGADHVFYPATARIDGDTLVLTSPQVAQPAAARYDWAAFPDGNLYNAAGLPAFPFRTDDWAGPMVLKK